MGHENDVEANSGDVTSEETGTASPVGLTFGGDYGSPTVQVAAQPAARLSMGDTDDSADDSSGTKPL